MRQGGCRSDPKSFPPGSGAEGLDLDESLQNSPGSAGNCSDSGDSDDDGEEKEEKTPQMSFNTPTKANAPTDQLGQYIPVVLPPTDQKLPYFPIAGTNPTHCSPNCAKSSQCGSSPGCGYFAGTGAGADLHPLNNPYFANSSSNKSASALCNIPQYGPGSLPRGDPLIVPSSEPALFPSVTGKSPTGNPTSTGFNGFHGFRVQSNPAAPINSGPGFSCSYPTIQTNTAYSNCTTDAESAWPLWSPRHV